MIQNRVFSIKDVLWLAMVAVLLSPVVATAKRDVISCEGTPGSGVCIEYGLGIGEPLDLTIQMYQPVLVWITGPVGFYLSDFSGTTQHWYDEEGSVHEIQWVSVIHDRYYWGKAGNLMDWIAGALAEGVYSGLKEALKAVVPSVVQALDAYGLATSLEKGQAHEWALKKGVGAAAELTGVGYLAKIAACAAIGGIVGAAHSEKGEVGIVCFAAEVLDLDWNYDEALGTPTVSFRVNSPAWHPYGRYRLWVLANDRQPSEPDIMDDYEGYAGADFMDPADIVRITEELSFASGVPAVTETGWKSIPWR